MAPREREVKVVVLGEDRGGGRVLKNLSDDAGKVEPGVAGVKDALSKLVEVLTNQLPVGGEQAKEVLGGVATSMAQGVAGANQLGLSVATGAALSGAALVAFGADASRTFLTVGSETRKLRGSMGGTAEDASRLRNIGKLLGIDVDTLSAGFVQFDKRLETNRAFLQAHGVELVRGKNGVVDQYQTLLSLGDAYKSIQDPVQRNVFLTTVFGRAGAELRGVLAATRTELEAFASTGPIMDEGQLKKARDMQVEMRLLKQRLEDLKVSAGGPALDFLDKGREVLVAVTDADLPKLIRAMTGAESAQEKAAKAAISHAMSLEEAREQIAETAAQTEAYTDSLNALARRSDSLAKAERAAADAPAKAARERERAARSVEDAERSLADAREAGAESVAAANRRIEDSQRSLDDAHRRELDAQRSLADAREGAAEDLERLRRAQERNAVAEERAAFALERAGQDIGKAKTVAEDRDARISLREAELSLADAQEKRAEDAQALNDAEARGVEGSRRVVDAKRGVEDATRAVGDAERAVTDAVAAAAQAQVDSARSVENAQRSLRDAIAAVAEVARSSLDEQLEKTRAVRDATREHAEALREVEERAARINVNLPAARALEERLVPDRFQSLPGRARGGPMRRGGLYVVGEEGPEVVQAGEDSTVFPTGTGPSFGTSVAIHNTFNVTGEMDAYTRWQVEGMQRQAAIDAADELDRRLGAG